MYAVQIPNLCDPQARATLKRSHGGHTARSQDIAGWAENDRGVSSPGKQIVPENYILR